MGAESDLNKARERTIRVFGNEKTDGERSRSSAGNFLLYLAQVLLERTLRPKQRAHFCKFARIREARLPYRFRHNVLHFNYQLCRRLANNGSAGENAWVPQILLLAMWMRGELGRRAQDRKESHEEA
jgi:hypothetical protein